ncbi:MAG: UDP-N-acetylmuramate--L-alanine ligase [Planctomycetota bacterium]
MDGAPELSRPGTERPVSRFNQQRVHFVGIAGCGMSGLAHVLLDAGASVTGTDPADDEVVGRLRERGCTIGHVQDGSLLTEDIALVVRTAAVKDDNAELVRARQLGLPVTSYADLLGVVMAERQGVAVAGTHGKTTTSALISYALVRGGLDPSFVVGGTIPQLGGGSHSGSGDAFVAEACEYDRSFLKLRPHIAVVTNVEADHLDTYPGGLSEIVETFGEFCRLVPDDGRVILNGDDPNSHGLAGDKPVWRVGQGLGCDWTLVPAGLVDGRPQGRLLFGDKLVATLDLKLPGRHNLINAAMAVAAAVAAGATVDQATLAVNDFRGVDRRQSHLGLVHGTSVDVVDDYGHHPTEIRVTLGALRDRYLSKGDGRLLCVFQPHQASRTRHLLADFATSFAAADLVFFPDIYSVRDTADDRRFVTSDTLAQRVRDAGQHGEHVPGFDAVARRVRGEVRDGDLVVTMGAGDVWKVGQMLVDGTLETVKEAA